MDANLSLVAFVQNAISEESAEICITVAEKDHNGEWRDTREGRVLHPFWTHPLEDLCLVDGLGEHLPLTGFLPTQIPDGWIEHIHEIARQSVSKHKAPEVSLAQLLGISKAQEPLKRRV